VGSLSGGERTRVALARLLLVPRNLLLLDEPTNHLDIPASEILEEALQRFDGTVVLVSHDRYFLERVATRVVALDGEGTVTHFPGSYAEFRESMGPAASAPQGARPAPSAPAAPSRGRESHEDRKRRSREEEKRQRRVTELEGLIAKGEARLKGLRQELTQAPGDRWELLARLADEEQSLTKKVDGWTDEWVRLQEPGDG
jgi:ATP-binding cassette subfamily F protein 3